jgi:hypothetical protein
MKLKSMMLIAAIANIIAACCIGMLIAHFISMTIGIIATLLMVGGTVYSSITVYHIELDRMRG